MRLYLLAGEPIDVDDDHFAFFVFLPLKPILCISNSPRGCLHSDVSHNTGVTDWVGLNVCRLT